MENIRVQHRLQLWAGGRIGVWIGRFQRGYLLAEEYTFRKSFRDQSPRTYRAWRALNNRINRRYLAISGRIEELNRKLVQRENRILDMYDMLGGGETCWGEVDDLQKTFRQAKELAEELMK